jgi:hypothetical protein
MQEPSLAREYVLRECQAHMLEKNNYGIQHAFIY